jgi:hypothetical protein
MKAGIAETIMAMAAKAKKGTSPEDAARALAAESAFTPATVAEEPKNQGGAAGELKPKSSAAMISAADKK